MKKISVIIPCRNQEDKIGETIDHIISVSKKLEKYSVEIVYVDDRSSDKSFEIAKKHLSEYKDVQLLRTDDKYIGNGKGMAVELGMTKASGEYRLFMDADNSTKFEEVHKLIPYFDKYDIVLGTRYSKDVVVPSGNWFKSFWLAVVDVVQVIIYGHAKRYTAKKKQGRLREFVSRGANLAFTVLLGQSFTDSRCGFKMYSKESSEKIFPLCTIKTWDFDSEALVLAKKFKYSMVEVPVEWFDDAEASNFKVKDMINGFTAIFKIRFNELLGKYKQKKSKSGILMLVAILLFLIVILAYNYFYCNIPKEIKTYVAGKENSYLINQNYCPISTGVKNIKLNNFDKLPKEGQFQVISIDDKYSSEIEQELLKNYSSFSGFKASGGDVSFKVYEVTCATCGQK